MIYYTFSRDPILLREAEALAERDHEVDIICLGKEGLGKEKYSDRIEKRKFNEKGIIAYLWKYTRFFILSSYLVTVLHLRKTYNLIHVTSPPDALVFTSLFPKLFGAKVILDIHDIMPEFFARKLGFGDNHWVVRFLKWIEKMSAKYSDHVITVTDIWKDTLVRRSVPESKCSVLLNAPDTKIFHNNANPKKQDRNKNEKFTLLYPGNLDFGVDTLIRAMQIIIREVPNISLEIYGDGSKRANLMKLASEKSVHKFVNFNKPVPAADLAKIMQNVDAGIDTMKGGGFFGEVLSGKSLEFLAMGVPVVISRTKATQHYFDDSMVMYFEPEDHEDLARAVVELYKNPKKRIELVNNAKRFNEIHNWDRYKMVYYNIVDSLCIKS
jgi:glycosyltransferase involved in cell wall biosynthesis